MTIEILRAEHDEITRAYYVTKTMTKEEFEAAHLANSIAQKELLGDVDN